MSSSTDLPKKGDADMKEDKKQPEEEKKEEPYDPFFGKQA
jgi:hypothetical protein